MAELDPTIATSFESEAGGGFGFDNELAGAWMTAGDTWTGGTVLIGFITTGIGDPGPLGLIADSVLIGMNEEGSNVDETHRESFTTALGLEAVRVDLEGEEYGEELFMTVIVVKSDGSSVATLMTVANSEPSTYIDMLTTVTDHLVFHEEHS